MEMSKLDYSAYQQSTVVWETGSVRAVSTREKRKPNELQRDCFATRVDYANFTGSEILVTDRFNITTLFHNNRKMYHNESSKALQGYFVIRVYKMWREDDGSLSKPTAYNTVEFDRFAELDAYTQSDVSPYGSALKEAFAGRIRGNQRDGDQTYDFEGNPPNAHGYNATYRDIYADEVMCTEFRYSIDDILNAPYGFYCGDTDVVICHNQLPDGKKPIHPYSRKGRMHSAYLKMGLDDKIQKGYTHHVDMVCAPGQHYGTLYINIMGSVKPILPMYDDQRVPGLYVYQSDQTGNGLIEEFVHFDQKSAQQKLGIYTNIAEAENYGDPKAILDRRKDQEERERLKIAEALAERQRLEAEAERERRHAREEELFRRQKAQMEEEEKRRDKQEQSDKKKRWWDGFFKLAASGLAVIGTILGLIIKYGPAKKA